MWALAVIVALYFYVRFAMLVARWLANKYESNKAKRIAWVAIALVFILMPTWDAIVGRIYFNHLCSTEAGVKVYQTVELPAEYWDAEGRARFFKKNGDIDHQSLKSRFGEPSFTEPYPSFFRIDETRQQLVDNSSQEVLGEVISFMYWGGWVSRNFSPHTTAVDCKEFHGNQFWHDFYVRLIKPVASTR